MAFRKDLGQYALRKQSEKIFSLQGAAKEGIMWVSASPFVKRRLRAPLLGSVTGVSRVSKNRFAERMLPEESMEDSWMLPQTALR